MKTWLFALSGLALLALTGCRTDPAIPILERQLRVQEDEIYRLRAMVDDAQDCSRDDRSGGSSRSRRDDEDDGPRQRSESGGSNGHRPNVELPSRSSEKAPDTLRGHGSPMPPGVPDVPKELQSPSKPLGRTSDGPTLEGVSADAAAGAAPPAVAPRGDSRRVASIALNRSMTGGINSENNSGDQGLLVVVEPRDRTGRVVDAPAAMSVMVLDPTSIDAAGKAERVGRWDFTAAETTSMFRRAKSGAAAHLAMAWPAEGPKHRKLHLFVRYTTADGRKLDTDAPIEIALPGDATAGGSSVGWKAAPGGVARDEGPALSSPGESWRRNETPPRVGNDEPPLRVATRPDRPAWSPDRR